VNQYKSTTKTVSQIGTELGASTILEGSVRRSDHMIRVALQLIDSKSQEHLWAATYDRELSDVFVIQSEVAERTAEALRLRLIPPPEEGGKLRPTQDLTAYDYYLKGVYFGAREGLENLKESFRWLEKATRQDPSFALAFAQWGFEYAEVAGWLLPGKEAYPRAKELIERALQLAPDLSEVRVARGVLALKSERDWSRAETELRRAISLNASNAGAHFWLAVDLFTEGRFAAAVEEFRTAIQLNPEDPNAWDWLAQSYLQGGDPSSAISTAELQRDRDPKAPINHARLGVIYLMAGRREDAERELPLVADLGRLPPTTFGRVVWACALTLMDQLDEARTVLASLEAAVGTTYMPLWWRVWLHLGLGQTSQALDLIEKDEHEGDRLLWWYFWVPHCDSIREGDRFQALLREAKLPLTVYHPPAPTPEQRA